MPLHSLSVPVAVVALLCWGAAVAAAFDSTAFGLYDVQLYTSPQFAIPVSPVLRLGRVRDRAAAYTNSPSSLQIGIPWTLSDANTNFTAPTTEYYVSFYYQDTDKVYIGVSQINSPAAGNLTLPDGSRALPSPFPGLDEKFYRSQIYVPSANQYFALPSAVQQMQLSTITIGNGTYYVAMQAVLDNLVPMIDQYVYGTWTRTTPCNSTYACCIDAISVAPNPADGPISSTVYGLVAVRPYVAVYTSGPNMSDPYVAYAVNTAAGRNGFTCNNSAAFILSPPDWTDLYDSIGYFNWLWTRQALGLYLSSGGEGGGYILTRNSTTALLAAPVHNVTTNATNSTTTTAAPTRSSDSAAWSGSIFHCGLLLGMMLMSLIV